ncbi:uncharacterized protein LODBEIA_P51450 [Lodderomyces beijingensis]|uniref:RING-type domain-containing protein n=1 Tax=Lodderomyces beijingensis TaxID=1775926 RepID=A0ABP0ZV55_9ASCO
MSSDLEKEEKEEEEEQIRYDDSVRIKSYATSFDITSAEDVPDLRNLKYRTSTDHLNCPVCQQPFIAPLTTICGHTFCKDCIYECLKSLKSSGTTSASTGSGSGSGSGSDSGFCPLDRTPLDAANINDLFPTPLIVTNLIDDLKVSCLNHERGCEWSGCRWEVEHHVLDVCPYTGVRCHGQRLKRNGNEIEKLENKCDLLVERRHMKKQKDAECVHRLFQCEFCKRQVSLLTQEKHLEQECLFNYKSCELCGNDSIAAKNLEKHRENCIKTGKIKCPAHEIGCKWVGSNETSLEIHLGDGHCQLNQFLPSFNKMSSRMSTLESENEFLQKQVHKILDSIIQGKVSNLGYNDNLEEINKFKDNVEDQDKLIYLNFELDRLKFEINEKLVPFMNKYNNSFTSRNEQENINNATMLKNLISDNFIMREDMNVQRMMINSLRKQLQYLLFARNKNVGLNANSGSLMVMQNTGEESMVPGEFYNSISRSNSEERLNLKL